MVDQPLRGQLPLGLPALFSELESQGVSAAVVCEAAGLRHPHSSGAAPEIGGGDLVAVFRAAAKLARRPETALRAGQRQTIRNFGVFGFALVTSRTFADAFLFGLKNLDLAGAVMHVDYRREGSLGILKTQNPLALGGNVQFVADFWRSSMTSLLSEVLGHRFPTVAMYFPFPAPPYVDVYQEIFDCDLHFASDTMEWHFAADVLNEECPNADALTSHVCQDFCEQIVSSQGQSKLQRTVRSLCMARSSGGMATAESVAAAIGMSVRTFHRRLAEEGITFKTLLDETRFSIASEYLKNTQLSVEEIAGRCGYGDVSNFRKAYRRWSDLSPSAYRRSWRDSSNH